MPGAGAVGATAVPQDVKVFACRLHEECMIAMALDNITCCGTCPEYQPCGATRG